MILNHHAASVLPYHVDLEGRLHVILERKDAAYRPPFFANGLNFLGGNWSKGINEDKSPEDVLRREINEEFWQYFEPAESLNGLLGQRFLDREPEVSARYDQASVQRIRIIGRKILHKVQHAADYVMAVKSPAVETDLMCGLSVFLKNLSAKEYSCMEQILKEFDGKVTTDNLKWGSRVVAVSFDDVNSKNMRFAWGYCHVMNDLLAANLLPAQRMNVIRPVNVVSIVRMSYPANVGRSKSGSPLFSGLESAGYEYLNKN